MRPGKYILVGRSGEPGQSLRVAEVVTISEDDREKTVVLDIGSETISGKVVVQDTNQPIPQARVELFGDTAIGDVAEAVVSTTFEGTFSVAGLGPNPYVLRVTHAGYGTLIAGELRAPLDLGRIALEPEARISVTVENDLGMSIVGAAVQLLSQHSLGGKPEEAFTNPQGKCRFAALAAGLWTLTASAPHHEIATLSLEVRMGREEQVSITLARLGKLRIHARSAEGGPLAEVEITIVNAQGEDLVREKPFVTDASGSLVVHDIPRGTYTVSHEPLGLEQQVNIAAGEIAEVELGGEGRHSR